MTSPSSWVMDTDRLVERAARRLRELEPDAIAVVVSGSYARGTADDYSDLDIRAITAGEPRGGYRTWFVERPARKPLHVSLGARSVDYWLAQRHEPVWWAFGFPALYVAVYVWATPEGRRRLGADPSIAHPADSPHLEGLLELAAKVRRASSHKDSVGMRFYARNLAAVTPSALLGLNEEVVVHTAREGLDAALSLSVAPEHYREDMTVCLGLVAADVDEVESAALRLTSELLAFLRERKPDVDPRPGLAAYLADGTLERYLGFTPD